MWEVAFSISKPWDSKSLVRLSFSLLLWWANKVSLETLIRLLSTFATTFIILSNKDGNRQREKICSCRPSWMLNFVQTIFGEYLWLVNYLRTWLKFFTTSCSLFDNLVYFLPSTLLTTLIFNIWKRLFSNKEIKCLIRLLHFPNLVQVHGFCLDFAKLNPLNNNLTINTWFDQGFYE